MAKKPQDPEICAMQICFEVLSKLSRPQQERVIDYLTAKMLPDEEQQLWPSSSHNSPDSE